MNSNQVVCIKHQQKIVIHVIPDCKFCLFQLERSPIRHFIYFLLLFMNSSLKFIPFYLFPIAAREQNVLYSRRTTNYTLINPSLSWNAGLYVYKYFCISEKVFIKLFEARRDVIKEILISSQRENYYNLTGYKSYVNTVLEQIVSERN